MYVHYTFHIISPTATISIQYCLPSTRHFLTIRQHQFCILFSPLHLGGHYLLSYNIIKVLILDVHSYSSFRVRVPHKIIRMSLILNNTAGNSAAWQMSIFDHASRLKYGLRAVHLSTNLGAPIFRPPPKVVIDPTIPVSNNQ